MGWKPLHPDQRRQRFRRQRELIADLRCPFERRRRIARWKRAAKNILVPFGIIGAIVVGILLLGAI
jgi:hypothetical protein